jgi:transcriptional regulator with XRE-family HTH domain
MPRRPQNDSLLLTFGQRITALRNEKSLTQRDLAERSGISPSHLSSIEHGRVMVGLHMLDSLARGLGVKLLDVVTFPEQDRRQRFIDDLRRAAPEIVIVGDEAEQFHGEQVH